MNERERFLATAHFQKADRYPFWELGIWGQTYERWLREGLTEDELIGEWFRGQPKFANLDRRDFIPLGLGLILGFERLIDEDDRYLIHRDRYGRIRKALKQGTMRGTRASMDTYIGFFVKNRRGFLEIKKHYDPYDPDRYPKNWQDLRMKRRDRDYPLYLIKKLWFRRALLES